MCFGCLCRIIYRFLHPETKNKIDITVLLSDSSDDDLYDLSD